VNSGNIGIVQVKENQKNLLKHCKKIAAQTPQSEQNLEFQRGHGRIEKRLTEIFPYQPIKNSHWDNAIKIIIKVSRERSCFDTQKKLSVSSSEESFYVCTKKLSPSICAKAVRSHWGIENSNHYVRDVSLNEDASRIRKNPDIFCTLRSFALNLLRANGSSNIALTRYHNALSLSNLLAYQFIIQN
jgi:predicted transposase YbfD/YdcC